MPNNQRQHRPSEDPEGCAALRITLVTVPRGSRTASIFQLGSIPTSNVPVCRWGFHRFGFRIQTWVQESNEGSRFQPGFKRQPRGEQVQELKPQPEILNPKHERLGVGDAVQLDGCGTQGTFFSSLSLSSLELSDTPIYEV